MSQSAHLALGLLARGFFALSALPAAAFAQPRFVLPEATRQLVVVISSGWPSDTGTLQRWQRAARGWSRLGEPVPVRLGQAGLGWGAGLDAVVERESAEPRKQEGDARAPAGVFALGPAFGEVPRFVRGTRLAMYPTTGALRCVDDPASPLYNQLTEARRGYRSAERMVRSDTQYSVGVVVGHNLSPVRPGAGSCIFLHVWSAPEVSTPGCTAMAAGSMAELVGWLDEGERPLLIQLPEAVYRARRRAWGLP